MQLANRVMGLTPSSTLAINAKAKELRSKGMDVVGLGAGEPDFNTPDHIIDAAIQAMKNGQTKYTAASGIPELKEAIIEKFAKDNGLHYHSNQIMVALGAKHALYNFFQVVCDPGDEVIIPAPYWVSYPEQVKLAEAIPVYLEGKEENQYKITPEQLESAITSKTKALIINSPSNPTGTIYSRDELIAIAEICKRHDILIVSDEIYEKLIYDGIEHVSIASLSEDAFKRTLVINGVSKPYAMTGWRIGYAAGDATIIKAMTNLASHSTSNPVTFAQYGALEALVGPQSELVEMRNVFEKRRNKVLELLEEIPSIKPIKPLGAFYIFVDVTKSIQEKKFANADDWANALLEEAKVAVVPGSGFGAPNFIRLSYATSLEQLTEAVKRIKEFVMS
ncbi:pyridoxal phosphate-dependent aminotransferase [Tepidibacillus sp. HK-1]|uniref:pyridoxal phosphate-dependent aminotransferase n=1 Tax=Tepidibacillus sp. HK-1 TaxID=1883407 RepID=UPI00085322F2|nr:pyridoxal phosphate-dependent aminotransferase [Tepidibacillus sp. HK-1]GBF12171.1 aspartate aminotransferase [Tepidibacillus sp. HK-1]